MKRPCVGAVDLQPSRKNVQADQATLSQASGDSTGTLPEANPNRRR